MPTFDFQTVPSIQMEWSGAVKVGAERGEGDPAELGQQQRLGFAKGLVHRGVDRLFDEAAGRLAPVAHGEEFGSAERLVDVAQGHGLEIAGDLPPSPPSFRAASCSPTRAITPR